ncbi:60Kd inner membrane protein-domain-containing protein [Jimgerdemannia flammicorona]|uniref:60Kd inner membrane protein-domain-containing protein n=1 Tax=Jimgerdemannia flammicorona TaxID=994334 RepID=A0A433Q1V8_9FUNG|nr:60Kd inner membrane protein-domain-containing protein [Jimgerdemannia flammicorona]
MARLRTNGHKPNREDAPFDFCFDFLHEKMFRLARPSRASLNVSSFGLRFGRQFSSQPLRLATRPFLLSHPPSTQITIHLHPIRTTPCLAISTHRHRHYITSTSNDPPTTATTFINGPLQPVDPATTPLLDTVAQTPTSDAVVQTAMHIGDLNAMGLVHWTPVGALESFLEAVHVATGLPWWGSIVATTVIIRIAMVPLLIKVQRNNARLANINPEVQSLMAGMNEAKEKQDAAAMQQLATDFNRLFKSNECHPTKSLLFPIVQMPVMISFFMALRAMSELPVPQFKEGGLLWITDLTMKDPYYILPVVSCLSVLTIFEVGFIAAILGKRDHGRTL